jgi:transcriptional regulator GlxA family with amidase domain
MTTYGILAFPNLEELDAVGPWEVFGASKMVHEKGGQHDDNVFLIAENATPIRANKGLHLVPDFTFRNHPHLDVVLVPGGFGTRVEVNNPVLIEWLQTVAAKATWVTSVCTGSLLLHGAGIAKDKRVATHHGFEDELEARGNITVVRGERWVVDGNVVSSQGVSAGIDMALWLIGQIDSPVHARAVQHYIQYDPAPPYQDLIDA